MGQGDSEGVQGLLIHPLMEPHAESSRKLLETEIKCRQERKCGFVSHVSFKQKLFLLGWCGHCVRAQ